jgi:hypothetical protein
LSTLDASSAHPCTDSGSLYYNNKNPIRSGDICRSREEKKKKKKKKTAVAVGKNKNWRKNHEFVLQSFVCPEKLLQMLRRLQSC